MVDLSDLTKLSPFGVIADISMKLIDRFVPDPEKKAQAALEVAKMQQAGEFKDAEDAMRLALGQMDVNKVEAANLNLWTSGWRPYIGWVIGTALAMFYIIGPLFSWFAHLSTGKEVAFAKIDLSDLLSLLGAMLGIHINRTYEKAKGLAK